MLTARSNYALDHKQVAVERLTDVVAVAPYHAADTGRAIGAAPPVPIDETITALFGERPDVQPAARAALKAFARVGWSIVPTTPDDPVAGHDLYLHENGELTIDTASVTLRFHETVTQADVDATFARYKLTRVLRLPFRRHLYVVRGGFGASSLELAAELERQPMVRYAEPQMIEHVPGRSNDPGLLEQWQWRNIDAEGAWNRTLGQETVIAVIDHGFHLDVTDFAGSVVDSAAYFTRTSAGKSVIEVGTKGMPKSFHGTFCAGLALARRGNSSAGTGMAPEAKFLPIVPERDEVTSQVTLARAVAYAASPWQEAKRWVRPADVISCSLGPSRWLMQSVLADALVHVATAGRGGLGVPVFWATANDEIPTQEDQVISSGRTIPVGRTDILDRRAPCAYGPTLKFLAPGQQVVSVLEDNNVTSSSGTSFAAPVAAAIAALMLSINPTLSAAAIEALMCKTCDPVLAELERRPNWRVGYGRVNAAAAVAAVKPWSASTA